MECHDLNKADYITNVIIPTLKIIIFAVYMFVWNSLFPDKLPLHVQTGLHCGVRHLAHLPHHSHCGVYSLQVRPPQHKRT